MRKLYLEDEYFYFLRSLQIIRVDYSTQYTVLSTGPYCLAVKLLVITITCSEIVLKVLLCLVVDGLPSIELDRHSDTEFLGLALSSSSSTSRLSVDLLSLGSFSSIALILSTSSNTTWQD